MPSKVFLIYSGLFALLGSVSSVADVQSQCKEKTPPSFNETFVSNCVSLGRSKQVCNEAYSLFLGAFVNRSESEVESGNYNSYFDILPIVAMANQSLFWSKTFTLVQLLSMMNDMGVNIISSETTVSGRILNNFMKPNLCWCSSPGNSGLVLDTICSKAATSRFWAQFSIRFSQAASGTIFFLADGNQRPAYNPSSFFGCYELINLNTSVVKRLVALNVHTEKGSACGTESFLVLKNNATSLPLEYTCYDIYGNAGDKSQTETIAQCLKKVISDVQAGTESGTTQINCSGVKFLEVSIFMIVLSVILSFV